MIYLVLIIQSILEALIISLPCIFVMVLYKFVAEKAQLYYYKRKDKRFIQRCEKEYKLKLQRERKKELHRKEKERYPLFYWKEQLGNGNH